MNQEIKQKWVAALRSGEYKQIKNSLTNGEGYCCLGVFDLLLFGPNFMQLKGNELEKKFEILGEDNCSLLADKNDNGENFIKIADYIEKNL